MQSVATAYGLCWIYSAVPLSQNMLHDLKTRIKLLNDKTGCLSIANYVEQKLKVLEKCENKMVWGWYLCPLSTSDIS
jgi:hypothetical protein